MTKKLSRQLGLLALLLPVLFITLQSSPRQAQASPFNRAGMWIWYIDKSHGGDLGEIIRQARASKVGTLYIKSGDGVNVWSQFTPQMVKRLKRAGLKVCGWQFIYGRQPVAEARVAATAKRRGANCFVINAEADYEGKYAAADRYVRELRRLVGPNFPLGLSSFPYVHYHPAFPYSVFLGPGAATANLPQIYWHTIGNSVRSAVETTWGQNRLYKRKLFPTGQTWEDPGNREILGFRRYMINYGTRPSWWSWQETNGVEWQALGKKVTRVPGYQPYRGHPTLKRGSRGDQVVWLQQHLIAAGNRQLQPTGIFDPATVQAVRRFQRNRGLEVDGVVGTQTWNRILKIKPVRVRWSAAGSSSKPAGVSTSGTQLSAPLSANLPAVKNELAGSRR